MARETRLSKTPNSFVFQISVLIQTAKTVLELSAALCSIRQDYRFNNFFYEKFSTLNILLVLCLQFLFMSCLTYESHFMKMIFYSLSLLEMLLSFFLCI